jgi:hypothetical protein
MPDLNIRDAQEVIIIIGDAGGDGGGWVVTPKGLKRIPDNNPELLEAYRAVVKNYAILKEAVVNEKVAGRNM